MKYLLNKNRWYSGRRCHAHTLFCVFFIYLSVTVIFPAPLRVYILAGQSNMEGQGDLRTFPAIGDDPESAPMLEVMTDSDGMPVTSENVWITYPARNKYGKLTAGYGAGDTRIGPEFTFGLYLEKHTSDPILLIKTAWGGKSLHTDFRSPSGGPYEMNSWQTERYKSPGHGIPENLNQWKQEKVQATGVYYRKMIEDILHVLKTPGKFHPAYNPDEGFRLEGFLWFQGWNDYCDFHTYPDGEEPGGYDLYSELLAHLIRDVRSDLASPGLPFYVGIFGVRGIHDADIRTIHFREAMEAPASLPEFAGNVTAVPTAPYWVEELEPVYWKQRKVNEMRGRLSPEEWETFKAGTITSEEEALWKRGGANGDYHYLGSARTFAWIGKAFADAVLASPPHQPMP